MLNQIPERSVLDERAAKALAEVVGEAAKNLMVLETSPCILAEAPNKFNDAWYDDLWHAVQIGGAYWEQSQFFEGMPTAVVEERSWSTGDFIEAQAKFLGSEVTSNTIASARAVLRELQRAGWRELVDAAFEGDHNLLALVIQHGQPWLCRTTPNGDDDGDVWVVTKEQHFVHFGSCDQRIDQSIGIPCPMRFVSLHRDALDYISDTARTYFLPCVADQSAFDELSSLLFEVDKEAEKITPDPVIFTSMRSGWRYGGFSTRGLQGSEPYLVWKNERFGIIYPHYLRTNRKTRQPERYPDEIYALSVLLKRLEDSRWRELFGTAFGSHVEPSQALSLFSGRNEAALVRENTKFVLTGGTLGPAQLCLNPRSLRGDDPPPDID